MARTAAAQLASARSSSSSSTTPPSLRSPSANTYQIIGEVTAGMDVVDAIAAMPNSGQPSNAAVDPLAMTKVTVANP